MELTDKDIEKTIFVQLLVLPRNRILRFADVPPQKNELPKARCLKETC